MEQNLMLQEEDPEPIKILEGKRDIKKWSEVKEDYWTNETDGSYHTLRCRSISYCLFYAGSLYLCLYAKVNDSNFYTNNHFNFVKQFFLAEIFGNIFKLLAFSFMQLPGFRTRVRCCDSFTALILMVIRISILPLLACAIYFYF